MSILTLLTGTSSNMKKILFFLLSLVALASCTEDLIAPDATTTSDVTTTYEVVEASISNPPYYHYFMANATDVENWEVEDYNEKFVEDELTGNLSFTYINKTSRLRLFVSAVFYNPDRGMLSIHGRFEDNHEISFSSSCTLTRDYSGDYITLTFTDMDKGDWKSFEMIIKIKVNHVAPEAASSSSYSCLLTNSILTFNYKQPGSNYNYDVQARLNHLNPTGGGMTIFDEDGFDLVYFTIVNNTSDGTTQDPVAFKISQSSCTSYRSRDLNGGLKLNAEGGIVTIRGIDNLVDGEHSFTRFEFTEKNLSGAGFSLTLQDIEVNGKLYRLTIDQKN